MLTILVSRKKQKIITADNETMQVRRAYVWENGSPQFLQQRKTFEDLTGVEIVVKEWYGLRKLPLTSKVEEAILKFLRDYHITQDMGFSCYSFASLVHGVTSPFGCNMHDFWSERPYKWRIKVGDALFLIRPIDKEVSLFCHAAIYIGRGLYISVYGAGGTLEISTLKDMQLFYNAKAYIAEPRS